MEKLVLGERYIRYSCFANGKLVYKSGLIESNFAYLIQNENYEFKDKHVLFSVVRGLGSQKRIFKFKRKDFERTSSDLKRWLEGLK
ncbi:hypothetical protein [Campylobacter mucosalis]|uniref:Uncharacterized protein n=1 Tax=Campylobacter mucosalis CCUG 21559 TaxID=1032067 RepID=A0A6G5QFN9_9BACT|nr:hypothetical protein [Campylobacter mucosalis]QCD44434.1 hypothetical protein CMUC_0635 [Campylobacter mucosalis CCUG 21559]